MLTTRLTKRRKMKETGLGGDLSTSQGRHKAPDGISADDRFRTGTLLLDWLFTAYEDGKARAPVRIRALDEIGLQQLEAQVGALEALGLLVAAGLGCRRHIDLIAGELKSRNARIRKAAITAFTMLPESMAEPHMDAIYELLAGCGSSVTRNPALTVLSRVPASSLETLIHIKLRARRVWRTLGWLEWARGLWAMTALSPHALTRQLVTIARASEQMRKCSLSLPAVEVRDDSKPEAAQQNLLDTLRARGKAPEGCDDWWSEEEVVALVRLLKEGTDHPHYEAVTSVLQHIDPTAVCLGVPALLNVALSSRADSRDEAAGEAAVRALNTFAYTSLPMQEVPPPPPVIAHEIAAALRSERSRKRAAAAAAVGVLHRRLAERHYPKLWELLNDCSAIVRYASSDALRDGAGEVEVKACLKDIQKKLKDRNTRRRELRELVDVLNALSHPWPRSLAPHMIRLYISHRDKVFANEADEYFNSFSGRDLSAALSVLVRKKFVPSASVKFVSGLLSILEVYGLEGFIADHVHFVSQCLGHSAAETCDSARKLLWRMSMDVRKPYLGVVASALMQQDRANRSYVKMLGMDGSGLAALDLAPVIEALSTGLTRLKALTVLRRLTKHHSELLRTMMSPVARCLHDAEDLVRVMALRVMARASVRELAHDDVHMLADQLLHADSRIRQEAMAVLGNLSEATLGLLGPWLVMQVLRVPQHEYANVTCIKQLQTKLPDACLPAHLDALLSAVESGCASVKATAVDMLMALRGNLLEPVLPRVEALISQHDAPAALRSALMRITLRVPPSAQTSTLANAVLAGMSDEEYLELREAGVASIGVLRYDLLRARARYAVSALLSVQLLRLVEKGADLLLDRAEEEMPEGLLKTIKRVVDEGSLSVRLAAANLMKRVPQPITEAFEDGYMSVDFNTDDSNTDEGSDSLDDDDAGDH